MRPLLSSSESMENGQITLIKALAHPQDGRQDPVIQQPIGSEVDQAHLQW